MTGAQEAGPARNRPPTQTTTTHATPRVRQGAESGGRAKPHRRGPDHGVEWKVEWRREAWSPATGDGWRRFSRRPDLDAFLAKLGGDAYPHLSPLVFVKVSWRRVGTWQEGSGP